MSALIVSERKLYSSFTLTSLLPSRAVAASNPLNVQNTRVTAMTPLPTNQQKAWCWNCKHLQKVYRGPPKNGMLFSHETHRCTITGKEFDEYWQITTTRVCNHHVHVGNWEAPPDVLGARQAWLAMERFGQLSRSQRLRPTRENSC